MEHAYVLTCTRSKVRKTIRWREAAQRCYLLHNLGLEQEFFYWSLCLCNISFCVSKFKIQTRPISLLGNMENVSEGQCLLKQSAFSNYEVNFGNCFICCLHFSVQRTINWKVLWIFQILKKFLSIIRLRGFGLKV